MYGCVRSEGECTFCFGALLVAYKPAENGIRSGLSSVIPGMLTVRVGESCYSGHRVLALCTKSLMPNVCDCFDSLAHKPAAS